MFLSIVRFFRSNVYDTRTFLSSKQFCPAKLILLCDSNDLFMFTILSSVQFCTRTLNLAYFFVARTILSRIHFFSGVHYCHAYVLREICLVPVKNLNKKLKKKCKYINKTIILKMKILNIF